MTAAFEPLVRISRFAFPYWLIAAVLFSAAAALITKALRQESFVPAAVAQFGITCMFLFTALGLHIQNTAPRMSFLELLPSSLVVGMVFAASLLIWFYSKAHTAVNAGMLVVAFTFFSVCSAIFSTLVLSLVIA